MVSLFLLFPAACAASILYYRRFFPSRQWLRGLWKNFLRRAAAPILFFAPAGCIRPEKNICLHPPAIGKRQKRRALARRSDCRKTYITKRVVRPTPINPQKAATCAWLFALLKGQVCAKGVHTAPCKNSKKWPKPLFRHAQRAARKAALWVWLCYCRL